MSDDHASSTNILVRDEGGRVPSPHLLRPVGGGGGQGVAALNLASSRTGRSVAKRANTGKVLRDHLTRASQVAPMEI